MIHKVAIGVAALTSTTYSIAGSLAVGVLGASIAKELGFDPFTWMLGALGGVVVLAKVPPTTRLEGLANGMISVIVGGMVAPWAQPAMLEYTKYAPNVYLVSFVLAALWPWLMKLGKESAEKWLENRGK